MATSFPPRRENSEGSPHRWRGAGRDHLCRPQRREHAKGDPRSRQRRSGGSAAPVRRRRLHERPSHGQGASRVEGVGCSRFSDEICPCRAPSLTSTSPPSASRRITSCRKSVLPASRSSSDAWLAFISYKDRKTVGAALKQIYRACDGPQSNCALSEVGEGSCQRR